MVIQQLEDHAFATAFQHVFSGIQLPASVGHRIAEGSVGRAGTLLRGRGYHTTLAEDPGQGRNRGGLHAKLAHLVVHADRPVIPASVFHGLAHGYGLVFESFASGVGRGFRAAGAGFECGYLPFGVGSFEDLVERFAADVVLSAERGDSSPGRIFWPSGDGEAYRRVNWIIFHTFQFISPPAGLRAGGGLCACRG